MGGWCKQGKQEESFRDARHVWPKADILESLQNPKDSSIRHWHAMGKRTCENTPSLCCLLIFVMQMGTEATPPPHTVRKAWPVEGGLCLETRAVPPLPR